MRKIMLMALSCILLVGLLAGCRGNTGNVESTNQTTTPATTVPTTRPTTATTEPSRHTTPPTNDNSMPNGENGGGMTDGTTGNGEQGRTPNNMPRY